MSTVAWRMYVGEYREQPFYILQNGAAWTDMATYFTGTAKLVMTWRLEKGCGTPELLKECTPAPTGTVGVWEVTDINAAQTLITFVLEDTAHLVEGDYLVDFWLVRDDGEWVPLTTPGTELVVKLYQGVSCPV